MKSYGDEYYDNPNQRVIDDSTYMFIETLNSVEGNDIYIDDIPSKAYITNSTNPNNETKEERTISVLVEQIIKTGSYIKGYDDSVYLVIAGVDNHISHKESKIRKCNHLLKWMYKGIIFETLSIAENNTKYTEGIKSNVSGITEISAMFNVRIPNNLITKNLQEGQRIILNGNAWRMTQVDFVTLEGLLSITLGKDSINSEVDDVENEIAGRWENKHTYTYNIPTSFEVSKDSTYQLNYSIKDETDKDFDYSLVTVTTTNNALVQITNTNGVITIKGVGIGIGNIKLSIPVGETSKEFNIAFEVKSIVVDKIEYGTPEFSNGTSLKVLCATTIKCTKYLNGIAQDLTIEWELDSVGQSLLASKKIALINKSNNEVQIKNLTVSVPTNIGISIRDSLDKNVILNGQVINLIK